MRRGSCVAIVLPLAAGLAGCAPDWDEICPDVDAKVAACSAELGYQVYRYCSGPAFEDCTNERKIADTIESCLEEEACQDFLACYPQTVVCMTD